MQSKADLAKRSDLHLTRRLWHVSCGVVCLVANANFDIKMYQWGIFSLIIASLGFFVDFKRINNEQVNRYFSKYFGPLLRKSERKSFSGLPFYALGVGLTCFLYPEKSATLAILFLIFADPMASIFGVRFGKDRIFPNKTLQGTIAAFMTCFFVTLIYLWVLNLYSPNMILFAFITAIFGAFSEALSAFNIDDNLTIPIVSGLFINIFDHLFQIF